MVNIELLRAVIMAVCLDTKIILGGLPNYCKLKVELSLKDKSFYKEDYHQQLADVTQKLVLKNPMQKLGLVGLHMERRYDGLFFYGSNQVYGNLVVGEEFCIEDSKVSYEYWEFSDQQMILPIIRNFEIQVIVMEKCFHEMTNGLANCDLNVELTADSNVDVVYYDTYDLFKVGKEMLLTYRIGKGVTNRCEINCHSESSEVCRRFLQMFGTGVNSNYPYIKLDIDDFNQKYRMFFS